MVFQIDKNQREREKPTKCNSFMYFFICFKFSLHRSHFAGIIDSNLAYHHTPYRYEKVWFGSIVYISRGIEQPTQIKHMIENKRTAKTKKRFSEKKQIHQQQQNKHILRQAVQLLSQAGKKIMYMLFPMTITKYLNLNF